MVSSSLLIDVGHTSSWLLAIRVGVALIGLGGVSLVFLTVSPKFISTFLVLPEPNSLFGAGIAIDPTAFLGLDICLLESLLELVWFLAQLSKTLLSGIGFLSCFLGSPEIGFYLSIFLILTTVLGFVRSMGAPMLLAQVAMLLEADFPEESGHISSTRSLVSCLPLDGSFLSRLCVGFLLCTYVICILLPQET